MTTRNEALEALAPVEKAYSRFGDLADIRAHSRFSDITSIKERLVDILVYNTHKTDAAEEFRHVLWFNLGGLSTSADVTRKVFAALGREDECSDDWI